MMLWLCHTADRTAGHRSCPALVQLRPTWRPSAADGALRAMASQIRLTARLPRRPAQHVDGRSL